MTSKITTAAARSATQPKSAKPVSKKAGSNADPALRDIVKSINSRTKSHYIETGRDLMRASDILEHGKLGPWLKENFGWSTSTARNYVNAAKLVDKNAKVADLQPAAVMALAAPSVPETVVAEVLADIQLGLRPTVSDIKAKIKAAKIPKLAKEADADDASGADEDAAPAPAADVQKSSYQELLNLLKRLGPKVAEQAITEAFAPEEGKPAPVPVQPHTPLADNDLSDEEIEELDLGQAA